MPSSSPKRQRTKSKPVADLLLATQNKPPASIALPAPSSSLVSGKESLLSSAFSFVEPTWRDYIRYVDAESRTGNPDAHRYLDCWIRIGERGRKSHYPEQLCELAKVAAADLVSWVSRQAYLEGAAQVSMMMTFRRAPVLAKVADFAMESAENGRQQEMFLKASGLLPTGGRAGAGAGILPTIFAPMGTASTGSVAGVKSESSPVDRSGLQDMDAEIVELSRIMQSGGTACAAEDQPDEEEEDEDEDEEDE